MSAVETAICAEVRNARLHVLFDVEGLLLDPEPGIDASSLAVRARFAPECRDAPLPALAASLRETLARVFRSHEPQLLEAAIQHYHQHYDLQGRFQARLRPGITALLKRMRSDRRLAWHYLSTHDATRAQRLLERFGLEDAVDSVLCMAQPCCMGFRPRLLDTFLREGGLSLGHDLRAHAAAVGLGQRAGSGACAGSCRAGVAVWAQRYHRSGGQCGGGNGRESS